VPRRLRSSLWRVVPFTFHTLKRLLVYLFVRWLLRYILAIFWRAPAQVWGWWVVLGGYGLVLGFVAVVLQLIALERWLAYGILWFFLTRWRWNHARLKQGVRPLFERRDDL
jgi:hypothetical protein